jgi:hypothetical protein
MGRVQRRRTRAISSPVTDGFVSFLEYAQVGADLSRFPDRAFSNVAVAIRSGRTTFFEDGGQTYTLLLVVDDNARG